MEAYLSHDEFFRQFEKDMECTCINCKKECICTLLAQYVRKVGIMNFKTQYYNSTLPKNIHDAFSYYFYLSTNSDDIF